jgi:hypothetical protein
MAGLDAARRSTVLLHFHGTHVILVKLVVRDGVSLSLNVVTGAESLGKEITGTNKFGFSGTFCVEFMLRGLGVEDSFAHHNGTAGVTMEIRVSSVRGVDPTFNNAEVVDG